MGNDNIEKLLQGEEANPPYSRLEKIILNKMGEPIEPEPPQSRIEELMIEWDPGGGGERS